MSEETSNQNVSLIWLDDKITDSQDNLSPHVYLRQLNSSFKLLKSRDEFNEYMESRSADARIVFMVNGSLGKDIVPDAQSSSKIIAIYIYCMNKDEHEKWALKYEKVKGVFNDFQKLTKELEQYRSTTCCSIVTELPMDSREMTESPMDSTETTEPPMNSTEMADPPVDPTEVRAIDIPLTYESDGQYLISDSCYSLLVRMKTTSDDKDDFCSFCHEALQGNVQLLALIREFQDSYSADKAISWFNRHPFFRGFLDNIFKAASIEAMFRCRVLIHDIYQQLLRHQCTTTIQTYAREVMTEQQFQNLKTFNGKTIAMKIFLLTNLDREKAPLHTSDHSSTDGLKRILFTIEANPQENNGTPFAKIGSIGYENDSDDVLFMIGALFKITEIEDEKDGVINIKMTLCANDEMNSTKLLLDQIKSQYINEHGETDAISFGQFLLAMGDSMRDANVFNACEQVIRTCLSKLPEGHVDRLRCYDALGTIDLRKDNLDSSLNWFKQAIDFAKERLKADDRDLVTMYQNLALIYFKQENYKQALEYYQKLLLIWKQSFGDDYINLIFCYLQMAAIYEKEEALTDATSCYYLALGIMVKHSSIGEVNYAAIYYNLGNICIERKQYHLALGYYNESLRMKLAIYKSDSPYVAATYKNIGHAYQYLNNVQQARENFQKAADIYRQMYSPDHAIVIEIEEIIRNLPDAGHT